MAFVNSASLCLRPNLRVTSNLSSFRGMKLSTPINQRPLLRMNLDTIQTKIQEEMKKAQDATATFGKSSKEAALAWDIVEELEAEASHMKAQQKPNDPLEEFCEASPEADECRVYDN